MPPPLGPHAKAPAGGKKGKKTLFGVDLPKLPLVHWNLPTVGVHLNTPTPLAQVRDMAAGALPGLVRLGGGLAKELAPKNPLKYLAPGQQAAPASERGWQRVEQKMPLTAAMTESVARTGRQIPDTAVGVAVNKGNLGQRLANTDLGHQVHDEGVLSTGLAKVADISMLFGGAGAIGKAAGAGHLAEAARLERLVGLTAEAAKVPATESALAKAAMVADAAGDGAKALDLAKAADQAGLASKLREGFSGSLAERGTEKAIRASHLGGRVAAAPFLPTEKALGLLGKGLGAAARSERLAPLAAKAGEALGRERVRRQVGDLFHEDVRAPHQAEMHTLFERHGLEKAARDLSGDEQAAIYLSKSQEALTPGVREALDAIAGLPEEVRPDAVARAFPDGSVTPEMASLARDFDEGTLPAKQQAKMQKAADALTAVQERRQSETYVTGEGTSRELSPEALRARAQRAAGQSADMDVQAAVDKATGRTRARLAGIEDEAARIAQTPAEAVPLSRGQERQLARDTERVRRRKATVKGETARGERTMGRAAREVERAQSRAANRTGQVIGRARSRLEEADQLETGLASRKRAAELKARRLAKVANATEDNATQLGAADEARAEANKIKGIAAAPTRSRVLSDVNLDAQRANVASRAETGTTERLLGREAVEQRGAVERAQKRFEAAKSAEAARKDRFERENQVRGDRAQEKRLATLDRQHEAALTRLAKEETEARNSVAAAAPQNRPALQVAHRVKQLMLDAAEAHPERAAEFKALADDIATTQADLEAAGVKTEFFLGGEATGRLDSPPPTAKLRNAKKLQSENSRVNGTLARDIKSQTEKLSQEALTVLHNKWRPKLQERFGSTADAELGAQRFATSEERAAALHEEKLIAWDPKTGKALMDAKTGEALGDITGGSAVLPADLYAELRRYEAPRRPGMLLRVYDKATGGWKHTVLAMSPRWHAGNIIGNAALATLGAGLTPAQVAGNVGEARRLIKAFEAGGEIPAEHVAAMQRLIAAGFHNPDLATVENARALGRLLNKSYGFNEYIDSVNRVTVYLAKHKGGVSSEAAVQLALKAAGDFSKMTPFERTVIRRAVPFYAWQRHITRLAFSLPIEAPARVAWTLHLSDLAKQTSPDPGAENEFNEGTIPFMGKRLSVRSLDPYGSSFFMDPTFRGAGYALNPVIKLATAAATGVNLNKGPSGTVSGTFRGKNPSGFGAPAEVMAVKHPAALAQFATGNVPQVRTLQDLIAGKVPVRYDTGEPRKVGKGASKKNAKPTLTGRGRKETVARLLGVPFPEPETKATTKK